MASLGSVLLFVLLAPVLLVMPGYLLMSASRSRGWVSVEAEAVYETVGLSVAISLSLLVLVGFALSQTVGLSRVSLLVAHLALLAGLGLLVLTAAPGQRENPSDEAAAGVSGLMPERSTSAVLLGLTLGIVVVGIGLYDPVDPYSEAYYANASEVPPTMSVEPEQPIGWTLVVENHEQRTAAYAIETRLIHANATNATRSDGFVVDQANLTLDDGEQARHHVSFAAPDCCTWKAATFVDVDGREEPLTMHRWIQIRP